MHFPRLISQPYLDVAVAIFSVSVTRQTIQFNIWKNKKNTNIKMAEKILAWNENLSKRCNHPPLLQCIRGLINGKSGCGKTTLLINLFTTSWLA